MAEAEGEDVGVGVEEEVPRAVDWQLLTNKEWPLSRKTENNNCRYKPCLIANLFITCINEHFPVTGLVISTFDIGITSGTLALLILCTH